MDVTEDQGIANGIAKIDLALADGSTTREDLATQAPAQHSKTASAPWYDNWVWLTLFPPTTVMVDNLSAQFSVNNLNPDTNKLGSRSR